MLFSWRSKDSNTMSSQVSISEKNGVRSLHLGNDIVQSSMLVKNPYELVLAYTRTVMTALLFHDQPKRVSIIGLGGGSLSKFFYKNFDNTQVINIEINDQVIRMAQQHFALPEQSHQFKTILGDGIEYIEKYKNHSDYLILDAYGADGILPEFCTIGFYRECLEHLTENGILIINLWGSDRSFDTYSARIRTVFSGKTLILPAEKNGNVIIFAFKKEQENPSWESLRTKAQDFNKTYGLEFGIFVESLKQHNLFDQEKLYI